MEELCVFQPEQPLSDRTQYHQNFRAIPAAMNSEEPLSVGLKAQAVGSHDVNYIGVSSNQEIFSLATTEGIEIIQNNSNAQSVQKTSLKTKSSVLIAKALKDQKTFAVVLDDDDKTVVLCDKDQQRENTEINFEAPVVEIICTNQMLVILLARRGYVFKLEGLKCIDQIPTINNVKGLCGVSFSDKPKNKLVALPHK